MKASIYKKYGSPSVLRLEEVEKPRVKNKEILVRVYATTVNRTDCAMLRAKPFIMRFFTGLFRPKKPILGTDFAGKIELIGMDVEKFSIGDNVFGFDDEGLSSHAEYLVINEEKALATIAEECSYQEAAASIEGAHYAINIINKVKLKKGQNVLVNGASGAIGSALVQLLKIEGLVVTAVSSGDNKEVVLSLGADNFIDYSQDDFTMGKEKYDYVFDAVGKSTFGKCKAILNKNGIYISSELGPYFQNIFYSLFTPLRKGKKVIFPFPNDKLTSVQRIKKYIEEGRFKPLIDRIYTLEEVADAFNYVEKGYKKGNVVIQI